MAQPTKAQWDAMTAAERGTAMHGLMEAMTKLPDFMVGDQVVDWKMDHYRAVSPNPALNPQNYERALGRMHRLHRQRHGYEGLQIHWISLDDVGDLDERIMSTLRSKQAFVDEAIMLKKRPKRRVKP